MKQTRFGIILAVASFFIMSNQSLVAQDTIKLTSVVPVQWMADSTVIDNTESTLVRMEHGVFMTLDTSGLRPGDLYTAWWGIFNVPENCSDQFCSVDDVFLMDSDGNLILDENGDTLPNRTGRTRARISLLRASQSIVSEDGTLHLQAHLPVGDANDVGWGPGLLDPINAHVHIILRSHGPASSEGLQEQYYEPWGGCPKVPPRDPCIDMVQIAYHIPGAGG